MQKSGRETIRGGRPRVPKPAALSLFSYGFRPFFLGAALWAIAAILAWIGSLTGAWPLGGAYGALSWHAHEMLFGYGSAAVAGFLLTAVPNWTGALPVAGWRLVLLFLIWCLGRLSFLAIGAVGALPAIVIDSIFLPCLIIAIAREVATGRNWRNLPPLALIGVLTVGNIVFHVEVLATGAANYGCRIGVAALIALIVFIGGRITPSFTHNWLMRAGAAKLPAPFGLPDKAAMLATAIALLAWIAFPTTFVTALLFLVAAAALTYRLSRWQGVRAWREPLLVVLHTAYAFVPLGFLLGAVSILWPSVLAGTAALHAWTVGAIGLMTLGVMTRATLGHTGRELRASPLTAAIFAAMLIAACLRIAAGFTTGSYMLLIELSGAAWIAAFILFLVKYAPMLAGPRLGAR
jgi:uncharacterized protein involved in response to NO